MAEIMEKAIMSDRDPVAEDDAAIVLEATRDEIIRQKVMDELAAAKAEGFST